MRHGSLFSGIGGFDLAAEWMGWDNVFHCENNKFCQQVLKYYWPESISYDDIKTTDFRRHLRGIDILTGGFPCQPYSLAGKRKGDKDDRHLWPEMLRAVREIQPRFVVGENVYGLFNWSKGLVFKQVQTDLENEGYEVAPVILPACAVNAPHRRDRIWFIAHSTKERCEYRNAFECGELQGVKERIQNNWKVDRSICIGDATYTGLQRQEKPEQQPMGAKQLYESGITPNPKRLGQSGSGRPKRQSSAAESRNWKASWADPNGKWPTVSPIRGRDDGLSSKLVKQCLEGLGNAIVPQVAYEIFKAIDSMN